MFVQMSKINTKPPINCNSCLSLPSILQRIFQIITYCAVTWCGIAKFRQWLQNDTYRRNLSLTSYKRFIIQVTDLKKLVIYVRLYIRPIALICLQMNHWFALIFYHVLKCLFFFFMKTLLVCSNWEIKLKVFYCLKYVLHKWTTQMKLSIIFNAIRSQRKLETAQPAHPTQSNALCMTV